MASPFRFSPPGFRSSLAPLAAVAIAVLSFFASLSPTPARADINETLAPGLVAHPLATPSGPRGKTMFVLLSPEETGVRTENKYADPEMWSRLSREIEIGAIGTGVTIGDYDGDGRPDIFVVSKTESSRLFRNLGNFKFEDVTEKAGVADIGEAAAIWKQGATFVDVNNDGLLDIYVCRFDAPNLLYINQGDGTFKEMAHQYGLDVKDACVMASFSDYDRDGWIDVFIQTNLLDATSHPEGQRDYLFHNNHDGTFTNVTDHAGIAPGPSHGNSATWWDFDGDGWPDLYVANDFAVPDALYHNNHDGTFTDVIASVLPHVPYSSMGSDLGDIDGDGRIDFMAADMAASGHVADQRTMAETRARQRDPDDAAKVIPQYPRNAIFLNTGHGRVLEAAQLLGLAATNWTWSVRWEDLDNDGRVDLYVTNGMHREIHNVDLIARRMSADNETEKMRLVRASPVFAETHLAFRNLGGLRFENVAASWGLDEKGVSFGASFGDLDGDGDLDLVHSNYEAGASVLRNDSESGHRVIIALRGTRSNRFGIGAKVRLETASAVQARELTLARGYMSSSEPIVHFGLGEEKVIRRLSIQWPSGAEQTFENLPSDRHFTITEPAAPVSTSPLQRPASTVSAKTAQTTPEFAEVSARLYLDVVSHEDALDELIDQRLLPHRFNRAGPALAVGDIDGKGESIIIGGTTHDPLRILQPQPAGALSSTMPQPTERSSTGSSTTGSSFTESSSTKSSATPGSSAIQSSSAPLFSLAVATPFAPTAVNDGPILLFDARGTGKLDLLETRGGVAQPADSPEYQPKLWLNDGSGHFGAAPADALPPLPISVGAVAAADFDRDGSLDLFIGGRVVPGEFPKTPRSALLANRGGKFEDVTDQFAPGLRNVGLVTGALWSDVDGDGWVDLLVTLEWGQVKYFHNRAGKGFDDWTEQAGFARAGNGWWQSIASADFNGDGRPDFVVGNVGLNTQYRADAEHPALLFAGDFSGRGSTTLIEAFEENGHLYPWRSRRDLATALPTLLRRYQKNDAYAQATLPEIVGQAKLDAATRLFATELQSGVFLSQPDGTYRFEPLPRIAQIAPLDGIVCGDFDGDGFADIYVVQNSFAPTPAVGRFDGGMSQLLRGDGQGHFTPVAAAESGLLVPGDAKALVVVDFNHDGWPDFVVSRNNDSALAFENRLHATNVKTHSVAVTLHSNQNLPTAVGAHVTAAYADGHTATEDVSAGSGYESQSTNTLFFGWIEATPIREFTVRWPDGRISHHLRSANSTTQERFSEPP